MAKQYRTPYQDLLPPLSTEEFEALTADIEQNGVRDSVLVDETDAILDGHNRMRIDPEAPVRVVSGLTDAEKEAFVFRANSARRNLSPAQKTELRRRMKATAERLRKEGKTQKQVAAQLGVARSTVELWEDTTNDSAVISCTPDARVKVNPVQKPVIAARVAAGETQQQVAADYGVTQQAIARIVSQETKADQQRKEQQDILASLDGDCGVHCVDFRQTNVPAESVGMIFTDPPYDAESASLYSDLVDFAASVLIPGGWLLAYSGQAHLREVLQAFDSGRGVTYAWTFCCLHTMGDVRFRKYAIRNGWKPIVGAYKPPLLKPEGWFRDVFDSGRKEKDSHPWQQCEAEAKYYIEHLSPAGCLVCDPFCGSGTTLAAAKSVGRTWLGYDVDEAAVNSARGRLQ